MLPDVIKLVTHAFRLLPASIRILEKFTLPTRILRLKQKSRDIRREQCRSQDRDAQVWTALIRTVETTEDGGHKCKGQTHMGCN